MKYQKLSFAPVKAKECLEIIIQQNNSHFFHWYLFQNIALRGRRTGRSLQSKQKTLHTYICPYQILQLCDLHKGQSRPEDNKLFSNLNWTSIEHMTKNSNGIPGCMGRLSRS